MFDPVSAGIQRRPTTDAHVCAIFVLGATLGAVNQGFSLPTDTCVKEVFINLLEDNVLQTVRANVESRIDAI